MNRMTMIYLDMDGVLADFERGVLEMCHMEALPQGGRRNEKQDDLMWEAIRETDHFYDRLEPMPGAEEMFSRIYGKYGDRCEILTGVPKEERRIVTAEEDKRNWTRRILSEKVKVNTVRRRDKILYCKGPESVLIDDREKTIREWRENGGTAIFHRSAEETLKELEEMGLL